MEKFSLKKYLEDPSRKVILKDGHEVRILCTDLAGRKPVVGAVRVNEAQEKVMTFTADGTYMYVGGGDGDLFFAPEKQSRWVYLYNIPISGDTLECVSVTYGDKTDAMRDMEKDKGFGLTEIVWEK